MVHASLRQVSLRFAHQISPVRQVRASLSWSRSPLRAPRHLPWLSWLVRASSSRASPVPSSVSTASVLAHLSRQHVVLRTCTCPRPLRTSTTTSCRSVRPSSASSLRLHPFWLLRSPDVDDTDTSMCVSKKQTSQMCAKTTSKRRMGRRAWVCPSARRLSSSSPRKSRGRKGRERKFTEGSSGGRAWKFTTVFTVACFDEVYRTGGTEGRRETSRKSSRSSCCRPVRVQERRREVQWSHGRGVPRHLRQQRFVPPPPPTVGVKKGGHTRSWTRIPVANAPPFHVNRGEHTKNWTLAKTKKMRRGANAVAAHTVARTDRRTPETNVYWCARGCRSPFISSHFDGMTELLHNAWAKTETRPW